MKIIITPQEAREAGVWEKLLDMNIIKHYWVARANENYPIELTLEEAKELGIWIE